jgi:hypothetical protein
MNFDFYQLYKDYSNTELLKIVKRPAEYQPAAVAVATQILTERQVITEEIQLVDQHFHDIDNAKKAKKEKIDALKGKATDFFEPVLHPRENVEPNKWVNILLFVIAIQYAWSLFGTLRRLIGFVQCDYCSLDITFFAELLTLLYVPLIFFLLFKRRRWGWILLFADNLFSLISRVSQSYIFFKYQSIHHGDTTSFLLPIFIKAAFVFFLWRDPIANHFGIVHETKKKTALVTTAGTLLFILIMYLMFGL